MRDTITIIFTVIGASAAVIAILAPLLTKRMRAQYKAGYDAHRLTIAEKKIDDLPCKPHEEAMHKHQTAINEHNMRISDLSFQLDLLTNQMEARKIVHGSSPLSLTELGKKVAKDLDLYGKVARHWDTIKKMIDANLKYKAPYDVQECCKMLVITELDKIFAEDEIAQIKQYAYENAPTISQYRLAANKLMRDEYLKTMTI